MADEQLENISFEEAMKKLEELVNAMENDNLPLDKMIDSYEQGSNLAKLCRTKLAKLEQRIEILSRDDNASGEWKPFDPNSSQDSNAGRQKNTDGFF
jgi:exodeoxyribonuclease VII small subunit